MSLTGYDSVALSTQLRLYLTFRVITVHRHQTFDEVQYIFARRVFKKFNNVNTRIAKRVRNEIFVPSGMINLSQSLSQTANRKTQIQ